MIPANTLNDKDQFMQRCVGFPPSHENDAFVSRNGAECALPRWFTTWGNCVFFVWEVQLLHCRHPSQSRTRTPASTTLRWPLGCRGFGV